MMKLLKKVVGLSEEKGEVGRYYVYELINPLTDRVFYVGKGTKDRVSSHEKETRAILKSGRMMRLHHKHKVILEIWDAGQEVRQNIVWRTDDEEEAFQVESRHINWYGLERLTNETYGKRPRLKRIRRVA